jgi:hypothetical protein
MKASIAAVLGSVLMLGACESPTESKYGPVNAGPSTVSFTYHGVGPGGSVGGLFHVTADPDLNRPAGDQAFALGQRIARAGAFRALSNQRRTSELSDWIVVSAPRLSTGSLTLAPPCRAEYCPEVFVALEMKNSQGAQARYSCTLDSGTIRITAISEQRAQGEFSGSGVCLGAPDTEDLEQFSVSNGRFDVKLRDVQN